MRSSFERLGRLWRAPVPLLGKELAEQAARRRTYVIRVVYAALLFLVFALLLHDRLRHTGTDPFYILGAGKQLFEAIIYLQFTGICLFLPAMMSGVITYEKERQSLALLLMTDLGPWEILLQKYFGRLIPMFTFLLLSLPLLAICYSLGGVTTIELSAGVFLLLLSCLQLGALAIMCSAFCRTTAASFISSYILGAVIYAGPAVLWAVLAESGVISWSDWDEDVVLALFPPFVFDYARSKTFSVVLTRNIPIVISTVVLMAVARVALVKRAFAAPKQRLLKLFKRQDRFWNRLNRLVGGIVLVKDRGGLPENEPVKWREVTKKPLGKVNYLLRLMVMVEVPLVLAAIALVVGASGRGQHESLSVIALVLWCIAVLAVVVKSANAVSSERTSRTLEVLLTTPLSGEDIIRQKMSGVWRMILVFLIPFLTIFAVQSFVSRGFWSSWRYSRPWSELGAAGYLVISLATVVVYLTMFAWFANWAGMRTKTRARAITVSLIGLVLWNLAPLFVLVLLSEFVHSRVDHPPLNWLFLLSPAWAVILTEIEELGQFFKVNPWLVNLVNLLWHGF
ncbi:MAG TPA: ABC transporter permease subunit, partial [Planctomycetota bacterium]|nr:ABC transporter permease subunit [Planctomycetota bacterium]